MAAIRNSISLQDRMTPVLRSMIKSLNYTLSAMQKVDAQANNGVKSRAYRAAEKDIKRATNELIRMKNYLDMNDKSAKSLSHSMKGLGASGGSFNLLNLSAALYLIRNIGRAMGNVLEMADDSRSAVARLGLFNTSNFTSAQLYNQVYRTALATRTGLNDTADLVNRTLVSGVLSGTGAPQAAIDFTGLINKTLIAGGGTQEQNQRALLQLSQGISSGFLQGDEARSIREQAPYLAKILIQGMGKIDEKFAGMGVGALKILGAEGELTSERIIKAFFLMRDEINASFDKMPKTFAQAKTQLQSMGQYMLYLLTKSGGALDKLNKKLWQFVDWLETPKGLEFIEKVANGISALADGFIWLMDRAADVYNYFEKHSDKLKAIFVALGAVAVASAVKAIVAWVAASWQVLLVAGLIYMVVQALSDEGDTAGDSLSKMFGGLCFVISLVYDGILGIIYIVKLAWEIIISAIEIIIYFIAILVGIVVSAGITILAVAFILFAAIASGFMTVWAIIEGGIIAVVGVIVAAFMIVLGVIDVVAQAIDAVFGTHLSEGVEGWMKGLGQWYGKLVDKLNPGDTFKDIGNMWSKGFNGLGGMYEGTWSFITKDVANELEAGGNKATWNMGAETSILENQAVDPTKSYDAALGWVDKLKTFDPNEMVDNALGLFGEDGVVVNGGNLDSIDKIGGDVNISDEDLQLLRDMAARDFLLNMQSITPVANVKFGDVKETADVNKLWDAIQTMVEEQLATSLVVN